MGRHVMVALPLTAVLAMVLTGSVLADTAVSDKGDTDVCQGMPWGDSDAWYVVRTASEPLYPNGATLRLSVVDIVQPLIATLDINVEDDTILLPTDWSERPDDGTVTSFPDWWTYSYLLTGLNEGGVGSFTITWGVSVDGGPVVSYPVTWPISVGSPCPDVRPTAKPVPTVPATDAGGTFVADDHPFDRAGLLVVAIASAALLIWRPFRRHAGPPR